MKTIGIIGGMSWESTTPYYEIINTYVKNKLGGLHSAKIILSSIDFYELEPLQRNHEWEEAAKIILLEAIRLQNSGADFIVICSNTGNECVSRIQKKLNIPILHIATPLGNKIKKLGYKKVALLGTIYTMEMDYISSILEKKYGLKVVVPEKDDRSTINEIIYKELCLGIFSESSKIKYLKIVNKLISQNIDAVIFGCTEIGLLLKQNDLSIPVLDTTILHAEAAAETALLEKYKYEE